MIAPHCHHGRPLDICAICAPIADEVYRQKVIMGMTTFAPPQETGDRTGPLTVDGALRAIMDANNEYERDTISPIRERHEEYLRIIRNILTRVIHDEN